MGIVDRICNGMGKVVMGIAAGTLVGTLGFSLDQMNAYGLHGYFNGYKARAGWNPQRTKIAKLVNRYTTEIPGRSDYEMVGAVDLNRDGRFQEDELVSVGLRKDSPLKKYYNAQSLEDVFNKITSPVTTDF